MSRAALLMEIANCTLAIKAFKLGCPWLSPDDLSDAPSIAWLEMQQRCCRRQLAQMRGEA